MYVIDDDAEALRSSAADNRSRSESYTAAQLQTLSNSFLDIAHISFEKLKKSLDEGGE